MKLILEICHASEYASDGWKMIQPVSNKQEFFDHLASPSFDVCLSLLCRLRNKRTNKIIEIYAFNGSEFVDIGAKSEIVSRRYDVDFAVSWYGENHPVSLCRLAEQHLPQEAYLRLCIALMEEMEDLEPEFVEWVKKRNFDEDTYKLYDGRFRITLEIVIPQHERYALQAAQLVLCIIKDFESATNALGNFVFYASSSICGYNAATLYNITEVTDMIRATLPFHEVIAWVTQP